MKKLAVILGFLIIAFTINAQVKINDKGFYVNPDGSMFTGTYSAQEGALEKSNLQIKDGLIDGEAQYFFASTGKLMETGMFEKGVKNGKWTRYNETGSVIGLAFYNLGKKDGTWTVWDDNGKKRFEMNYAMGEKTGVWYNWDDAGQIVSTKDFSQVH